MENQVGWVSATAYRNALKCISRYQRAASCTRFYSKGGELRFVDCCHGEWVCHPVTTHNIGSPKLNDIGQEF